MRWKEHQLYVVKRMSELTQLQHNSHNLQAEVDGLNKPWVPWKNTWKES